MKGSDSQKHEKELTVFLKQFQYPWAWNTWRGEYLTKSYGFTLCHWDFNLSKHKFQKLGKKWWNGHNSSLTSSLVRINYKAMPHSIVEVKPTIPHLNILSYELR